MSYLNLFGPNCAICNKPMPDWEPEICCNGLECGCKGLPIEPCICSQKCSNAAWDQNGTIEERIKRYNIEIY